MTSIIDNIKKAAAAFAAVSLTVGSSLAFLSSCADQESNLVTFVENNRLNTPNDTLNSLLGIINKMQVIVDRTVLLGEIRGDLISLTDQATLDLRALADFESLSDNPYNQISDYYAVIQNCNYFLAYADTTLKKQGRRVFEREYAAVKSYRAWTYLQLALNYGSVPFFTAPLLTEKDADVNRYPKYDVKQIAEYFIDDIAPYADTEIPQYGSFNGDPSTVYFIPVRALMGDLCLYANRYADAAKYYHDFLTKTGDTHPTGAYSQAWGDETFSVLGSSSYMTSLTRIAEVLFYLPVESEEYDGIVSDLNNVFNSTEKNSYYYQASYSPALLALSQSQKYAKKMTDPITLLPDTLYDTIKHVNPIQQGDLRLSATFSLANLISSSSSLSSLYMTNRKYQYTYGVPLIRLHHIYLRFAEALNRAGFPNSAFAVLKYGLWKENIEKYIPSYEREAAGDLLSFSEYQFTRDNTQGIHTRGSGDADVNKYYVIPECASKADSIKAVEDLICDEMALESAAEGCRFYDLMRISLHRDDPTFLAGKVARRDGTLNSALYEKLSDRKNWYLPF